MPVPTITPTGDLGKTLLGLAYLVANSAQFRTLVGAASVAAAMAYVHADADDTADSPADRPRAIVGFEQQYDRQDFARNTFSGSGALLLSFEFAPSAPVLALDSPWDEILQFCERVDTIVSEMQALGGTTTGTVPFASETHFTPRGVALAAGPSAFCETRGAAGGESRQYLYGVLLRVTW